MRKSIVLLCIIATCAWIEAKPLWFSIDITCDEFGCESKNHGRGNRGGGFRQVDYHGGEYNDKGYDDGRYGDEEYSTAGSLNGRHGAGRYGNDRFSAGGDEYDEYGRSENDNIGYGSYEYGRREYTINRFGASEYDQMGLGSVYDRHRYGTNKYGTISSQGGGYEYKGNTDCEYGSGDRLSIAENIRCGYGSRSKHGRRVDFSGHHFGGVGGYGDGFRRTGLGGDNYSERRIPEDRDMMFEEEDSDEDSGEE